MPTSYYRTTDEYLATAIARVQALGSRITDFNVGSGARTLFEGMSSVLSHQSLGADQIVRDTRLATALGEALDAKAADYLVERLPGTIASGVVRISRESGNDSILIPEGFQLTTRPTPGQTQVAVRTTEEVIMTGDEGGAPDAFVDVAASAIAVGAAGNLAAGTMLLPESPILGVLSDGGFAVQGAFDGGTDVESDDAFRQRIRIEVQGRANGRRESFLAAALGVPGVTSAKVLRAGDLRSNATPVEAGQVEIYFKGAATFLNAVQQAVEGRATLDQNVTAFAAGAAPLTIHCDIAVPEGADQDLIRALVKAATIASVERFGVGENVTYASTINAIMGVPGVIAVDVPLTDHRLSSAPDNTAGTVVIAPDKYASIVEADITVDIDEV